jgi:hypothetical protein
MIEQDEADQVGLKPGRWSAVANECLEFFHYLFPKFCQNVLNDDLI